MEDGSQLGDLALNGDKITRPRRLLKPLSDCADVGKPVRSRHALDAMPHRPDCLIVLSRNGLLHRAKIFAAMLEELRTTLQDFLRNTICDVECLVEVLRLGIGLRQ